jgi:hypothetical protein
MEPQNRHKSGHFGKNYSKLKTKRLWRITIFFAIFLMNNKLVTSVLCFGSHVCNQAARIRVKGLSEDAGRAYFLKTFRASLYLSNEPNFDRIHLAGQYL